MCAPRVALAVSANPIAQRSKRMLSGVGASLADSVVSPVNACWTSGRFTFRRASPPFCSLSE